MRSVDARGRSISGPPPLLGLVRNDSSVLLRQFAVMNIGVVSSFGLPKRVADEGFPFNRIGLPTRLEGKNKVLGLAMLKEGSSVAEMQPFCPREIYGVGRTVHIQGVKDRFSPCELIDVHNGRRLGDPDRHGFNVC